MGRLQKLAFGEEFQPFLKTGQHWWDWSFRPHELGWAWRDRLSVLLRWLLRRSDPDSVRLIGSYSEVSELVESVLRSLVEEVASIATGKPLDDLSHLERREVEDRLQVAMNDLGFE